MAEITGSFINHSDGIQSGASKFLGIWSKERSFLNLKPLLNKRKKSISTLLMLVATSMGQTVWMIIPDEAYSFRRIADSHWTYFLKQKIKNSKNPNHQLIIQTIIQTTIVLAIVILNLLNKNDKPW